MLALLTPYNIVHGKKRNLVSHTRSWEDALLYTYFKASVYFNTHFLQWSVYCNAEQCTRNLPPRTTLFSVHFHEWSLSNVCFLLSIKVTIFVMFQAFSMTLHLWMASSFLGGIFHQSCASFKFGFDHENASCLVLRCYKFEVRRHWAKPFLRCTPPWCRVPLVQHFVEKDIHPKREGRSLLRISLDHRKGVSKIPRIWWAYK